MFRALLWVTFVAACVVVVDALARPHVGVVAYVAGLVAAVAVALVLFSESDVLADHPDELEERRRARAGGRRSR